jgi:hypothetical protein
MLDTPRSEVVVRVLATHSIRQVPLPSPPPDPWVTMCHHISIGIYYVKPCRSLRVTRSLQHQDKSDFCKLFLIESRIVNNFPQLEWIPRSFNNILFYECHIDHKLSPRRNRYLFWIRLTAKTVPLLLKSRSRDHPRTLLQPKQGRSEPSCFHFTSQKEYSLSYFG